jgi:hypothetical protein
MNLAGYSGTPLANKLGIKEGQNIAFINVPGHYFDLFTDLGQINRVKEGNKKKDLVHYFVTKQEQLIKDLPPLKKSIEQNGCIWISWPKKSSKVKTDITEDIIRKYALHYGLVDVKVCAVDEVWSALKLVIPIRNRSQSK